MEWLNVNYKWIFDGVGAALLIFLLGLYVSRKSKNKNSVKQEMGTNVSGNKGKIVFENNEQKISGKDGFSQSMGKNIKKNTDDIELRSNKQNNQ